VAELAEEENEVRVYLVTTKQRNESIAVLENKVLLAETVRSWQNWQKKRTR